ncbi:hypothetical protein ACWIGB_05745 [Streptomyces albidoflavus]
MNSHLSCELEGQHPGWHWALAQSQDHSSAPGDCTTWWVRWTGDKREWRHDPHCEADGPEAADFPCGFPLGHEGAHSWS